MKPAAATTSAWCSSPAPSLSARPRREWLKPRASRHHAHARPGMDAPVAGPLPVDLRRHRRRDDRLGLARTPHARGSHGAGTILFPWATPPRLPKRCVGRGAATSSSSPVRESSWWWRSSMPAVVPPNIRQVSDRPQARPRHVGRLPRAGRSRASGEWCSRSSSIRTTRSPRPSSKRRSAAPPSSGRSMIRCGHLEVYECGEMESCFFVAMEYCEGRSLADILQSDRRIDQARAARYAAKVAAS